MANFNSLLISLIYLRDYLIDLRKTSKLSILLLYCNRIKKTYLKKFSKVNQMFTDDRYK